MAFRPIGINLSNCTIDFEKRKVIEYPKKKDEGIKVYDLDKIEQQFHGVEGLSFSITGKVEVVPDSVEY